MSKDTEALGYLWRRIDADEGPGVWNHSENSDLMRLFSGRDDYEVRDVAAEFRQLAEQRAALLEALILLLNEVDESAVANARDFGWPVAVAKSRAAIALAQGDAA